MYATLHVPGLGFGLSTYSIAMLLAVGVGLTLGPRAVERHVGIAPAATTRMLTFLGIAAFVGGHLHFAVAQWIETGTITLGGMHAPGAILALVLAAPLAARTPGWQRCRSPMRSARRSACASPSREPAASFEDAASERPATCRGASRFPRAARRTATR
jgi:prolipoprotein diacylglyceryltransferase